MGFDDLKNKATGALDEHSDKVENVSDQGIDRAGEFAEGKGASSDHVDKGKDFVDGKIGDKDDEADKKDKN